MNGGRFASVHLGCHIVICLQGRRAPENDTGWTGSEDEVNESERKYRWLKATVLALETGGAGTARRLVIVESPTKARKLAGYLGANYIVEVLPRTHP